jgi:hypothetical protein
VAVEVTVALVGEPSRTWENPDGGDIGLRHPDDWRIPYRERPKVVLEVPEAETLGAVLRRAGREFGMPRIPWNDEEFDPPFVSFYREDRDPNFGSLQREIALVDDDGRVRWTHDWHHEPISELIRAGEAGVLNGDPRRPYLICQPPIGNGLLVDWPTLVELWKLWWDIANKVGILAGLWMLWETKSRRLKRREGPTPTDSPTIVEGRYAEWQANGGRPDNFVDFLGQRPWHVQDLADALGCTPEQAEALLIGFGHERNSAGLWVPGASEAAQLLRDNAKFVMHAGMTTRRDDVEEVLRQRAEHFQRTGSAPPLDWKELRWLREDHSRLPSYDEPTTTFRERLSVVLQYRAASALHRIRRRLDR